MVSGADVRGDWQSVGSEGYLGKYDSQIGSLSGSWEGASYNKLKEQAAAFVKECAIIGTGMEAFASACDDYATYKSNKDYIEKEQARISDILKNDKEADVSAIEDAIKAVQDENDTLAKSIRENLEIACSTKIEGVSVGSLVSFGGNIATGLPGELGGDSGILSNARIGENGRPDPNNNIFFQSEANGGINGYPLNGGGPGVGGNCTYYAYSRFSELIGEEAHGIADGDACSWYANTTGYKKGQTPKLGAIAVWRYGNSDRNGHVAVVEEIKSNGDIVVSEGGWSSQQWYGNRTYKKSNNYATGYSNGKLVGFIYPEKA